MAFGIHFRPLLGTAALFSAPLVVFVVLAGLIGLNATLHQLIAVLLTTVAIVYASAAASLIVEEAQETRQTSLGAVLEIHQRSDLTTMAVATQVMGHTGALLPTALLSGLLIYVGACLMYVPALVPFLWTMCAGPIVLREEVALMEAIQRGRQLMGDGRWINALIVAGVFGVIIFGANFLAPIFFKVRDLLTHSESTWQKIAVEICMGGVDLVVLSLWSVWAATAYADIVEELRKAHLAKTPPPPPPKPSWR